MCLNLPAEELPAAFADPTSRQLKQGRVSVVFAGNGTSRPDAALAEREFAVAPLGKPQLILVVVKEEEVDVKREDTFVTGVGGLRS